MKQWFVILFSILLTSCFSAAKEKEENKEEESATRILEVAEEKTYDELKEETLSRREEYLKAYKSFSNNKAKQDSILADAEKYLLDQAASYFISWHGTPWDFNGHTEVPRSGQIACGFFVTTTLRDMGFRIPRIRWAQQHADYVIYKLTNDIKRFKNVPIEDIEDYIENKGEGLYIVGLDSHVGYIFYHRGWMRFVHSNYYLPKIGVMSEDIDSNNPLNRSIIKVIGKIFEPEMVRNWMFNTAYSE